MITPHETLVIRCLVGGSWSTGGTHFRVQKQSPLSPRFKVALHSTWFYLFCLHKFDRWSQRLECEDFRRCQNFTWLLIHANACTGRTFSVPNVRQTLIIPLTSTAPCSSANLRKSRRKATMQQWRFSKSGMKKGNFRLRRLRAKMFHWGERRKVRAPEGILFNGCCPTW